LLELQKRDYLKAIIGATATGKSDFAINLAEKSGAEILSLDSLSVFKEVNIVSAKPSKSDLSRIKHHGIDEIFPNEKFSVKIFIELYEKVKSDNLIIVGGTSFYLKTLLTGLSPVPEISKNTIQKRDEKLENLAEAHHFLANLDSVWGEKVKSSDRYRIEKGLDIYFETGETPTQFFINHKPKPIITEPIKIINLQMDRDKLRARIWKRTEEMLEKGMIDEVEGILKKYGENIEPMRAIGLKETLQFLRGEISSKKELINLIATHTSQFAKRQRTFNRTQFQNVEEINF
jgi:tRNA dimethylallyltransferase